MMTLPPTDEAMKQTTPNDLVEHPSVLGSEVFWKCSLREESSEIFLVLESGGLWNASAELLQGFDKRAIERQNGKSTGSVTKQFLYVEQITGVQAVHKNLDTLLPISLGVEFESLPVPVFVVSWDSHAHGPYFINGPFRHHGRQTIAGWALRARLVPNSGFRVAPLTVEKQAKAKNKSPLMQTGWIFLASGFGISHRRTGSLPLEQLFHPTQMPVNLKIVSGGSAKRGTTCKPSFHPSEKVGSWLRILRKRLVHIHVHSNIMVKLLTFRVEIRVIKVQENLTFLDPPPRDRICGIDGV
jgi:hypothetical protein